MRTRHLGYVPHTLALREQSRRRATLIAIALLFVLSTSPVYVHHLFELGAARMLAGFDHIGALCVTALHLLLLPVHRVFHVVLLVGIAVAAWDRLRAWRTVRATLALLEQHEPVADGPFWRAALAAGVDPGCVRVVRGLPNPAFTVGLLTPRVYLAAELAGHLTAEQLEAVIAHEGAHVVRRDPLRQFLLRFLAFTLFWMPALRRLAEDVRDEAEVLADDAAVRGRPLVLASAILALSDWNLGRATPRGAVGFQRDDLLERRVRRLVGEETAVRSHLTRRSVVGAVLSVALVWGSGLIVAHPLPAAGTPAVHAAGGVQGMHGSTHGAHCMLHRESALAHLFCLGSPFSSARLATCPHYATAVR